MLPVGTEQPSESSGKGAVSSSGAAESAALAAQLAIVVDAWSMITPHCRSIVVGMARKAILQAAPDRTKSTRLRPRPD